MPPSSNMSTGKVSRCAFAENQDWVHILLANTEPGSHCWFGMLVEHFMRNDTTHLLTWILL